MLWNCGVGKDLESPLDWKEIKPVNPKRNQPCIFIGRTDAEAEAPILWPLDVKSRLIGKDFNAGKDWRQEKGTTEDETAGWHHQLKGHAYVWAPGWWWTRRPCVLPFMGSQELNMNEQLNWTEVDEYSVRFLSFFPFDFLCFCFDGQDFCFSLEDIPLWM